MRNEENIIRTTINDEDGRSFLSKDTKKAKGIFGKKNKIDIQGERNHNLMTNIFDKIISVSLFMLFLGVPLFFTGVAFQGIVFEKQIYFYFFTLLALISWASKSVITGEMKIRRTPLDIPIIVFWVIYGISTIFSVDKWHSFWGFFGDPSRGFMGVTAMILIYYLILNNFTAKRFYWMLGGILTANLVIVIWSILILLGVDFMPDNIKPFIPISLLGTMTGLKIFLGAMIPVVMVGAFKLSEKKNIFKRIIAWVLAVIIPLNLFVIMMLYDRMTIIIILLGIGLLLLYVLSHVIRPKEKLTWVPMMTFILAMAVLMVGGTNLIKISIPLEATPTVGLSWEITKGAIKENALIGSGPATYGFDFSKFKPMSFNQDPFYGLRFYQGKGLFFEALATIGVLGTLALVALSVVFINIGIYLVSMDKEKNKIYSVGLLAGSIVLIVGALFIRLEGSILILTAMLGSLTIATILWESRIEGKFINLSLKASPKFALTLAFLFIIISAGVAMLFVFIGKAYVADIYAGKGALNKNISQEDSLKDILNAIRLNKKESRYYLRAGQEFMILVNNEAVKAKDEQNLGMIREGINNAIIYSRAGKELVPADVMAKTTLAQIYENSGLYIADTFELAIKEYEDALKLEPHNPVLYLKIGQIELRLAGAEQSKEKKKEHIEKAKEMFEKAVEKKKDFEQGYYYLATAQGALGDKNSAIASMISAIGLSPNNVNYIFELGKLYQSRNEEGDYGNAEKLFIYITSLNPKEINAIFALGRLYEYAGKNKIAKEKYQEVIDVISEGKADNTKTIDQIKEMIRNIDRGIGNIAVDNIIKDTAQEAKDVETKKVDLIGPTVVEPVVPDAPVVTSPDVPQQQEEGAIQSEVAPEE